MSIVFTYWGTQKLSVTVNGICAQTKLEVLHQNVKLILNSED